MSEEVGMEVNQSAPVLASAEAEIEAPAARVWAVLSDIRNWPSWNPEVSAVSMYGEFVPGTDFRWKASGVTIISELQEIEPKRRLLWTGRSPGIRATHLWLLEEQAGNTRVRTEECFEGLMARLLKGPLNRMLAATLEQGLQSLKQECERTSD
jgi:hypothetical protein